MSKLRRWAGDLLFGARLAVGSGRALWGRLALTAIGIGLGVAMLLLASSVQNMIDAREVRDNARPDGYASTKSITDPRLLAASDSIPINGEQASGVLLDVERPDAPVPAGLPRNPMPGEMMVSPALARMLDDAESRGQLSRSSQTVAGVVGDEGLLGPGELFYYKGVEGLSPEAGSVERIGDHIVSDQRSSSTDWELWVFLTLGVAALLVPVVVFVASTTRLAEAARQRRLSALRLVGAGGRQVRRIASGEALMGAVLGVAVGWALYGTGLMFASHVSLMELSVFSGDIWPSWWLALLVTGGVPILATVTAISAQRRTISEPLSVVRQTVRRSRGFVWRIAPIILGMLGLLIDFESDETVGLTASIVLVLVGVALVLPWLLDRLVQRLGGGSLAWQLAIRRLQLTSGAVARSVSAVAVVLTGLIALLTVIASIEADKRSSTATRASDSELWISGKSLPRTRGFDQVLRELEAVPGTGDFRSSVFVTFKTARNDARSANIEDCDELIRSGRTHQCQEGDVFVRPDGTDPARVRGDETWTVQPGLYEPADPLSAGDRNWKVPGELKPLGAAPESDRYVNSGDLVLTPGAAESIPQESRSLRMKMTLPGGQKSGAAEFVRDIVARDLAQGSVSGGVDRSSDETTFELVRYGLLLGAVVTFVLIGCGLLVAATEQVQERRRYIAVLGAVGAHRAVLAGSVLLQNALAMVVAGGLALGVGLPLGVLVVHVMQTGALVFDFAGIFALVAMAGAAVLVVTSATLPALRRALRPEGLRSE